MSLRSRIESRFAQWIRPRAAETLPVQLDRRRVYVLPTRFGLFYAGLLLAMLLGALNYNNNPALLLALLLGTAGLASLIVAHLQLSGLRIDAIGAEPVAAGQTMRVHLALSMRDGHLRSGLRARSGDVLALVPSSSNETVVTFDVATRTRGWFDTGRIRLFTTQPLGLAEAWSWTWPRTALLVYPAPEQPAPPLPPTSGNANSARLNPAGEDMHHLRAYRPGDARHAIAWKPSARRDTLLVREYEQPQGGELQLDWQALSSLPYEQRIRRLAAWIDAAEREGRGYRLTLPNQPALGPAQGAAHRHACLRALALLPAFDKHDG